MQPRIFCGYKLYGKVLSQMDHGDFYAFPEREGIQEAGAVKKIIGGDGAAREVLSIPGVYKGREGTFDFIKESDGFINHRRFEPSR